MEGPESSGRAGRSGRSGGSGTSGISGSLRKRPVRAAPENPEPPENPKRKQPRTQIYAFCPKTTGSAPIYLPCHRAFTHEMPHAPALQTAKHTRPAPKSVSLRFPPEQAEGRSGTSGKSRKSGTSGKTGNSGTSGTLRNPPAPPPPRTQNTDYLQSHILQFKTQHTYFNYK